MLLQAPFCPSGQRMASIFGQLVAALHHDHAMVSTRINHTASGERQQTQPEYQLQQGANSMGSCVASVQLSSKTLRVGLYAKLGTFGGGLMLWVYFREIMSKVPPGVVIRGVNFRLPKYSCPLMNFSSVTHRSESVLWRHYISLGPDYLVQEKYLEAHPTGSPRCFGKTHRKC
jgi:hypothetical protein